MHQSFIVQKCDIKARIKIFVQKIIGTGDFKISIEKNFL